MTRSGGALAKYLPYDNAVSATASRSLLDAAARACGRLLPLVKGLWLAGCAAYLALLAVAVCVRVSYPYPLEWLEPVTSDIVGRILRGLPVYCKPTLSYVAPMKTPLYYYVVAPFAALSGDAMVAGRGVSIMATLGTLAIIWRFARRHGTGRLWALCGVGVYAATYGIAGRWFDIARIDPLFIVLLSGGLYGLWFWRRLGGACAGGLLLVAAYFTKQTALIVAVPALLGLAAGAPKRALAAGATLAAGIAIGMAVLQYDTDGWSTFFLTEVPAYGTIAWADGTRVVGGDLLALSPALLACAGLIFLSRRDADGRAWFYAGLAGGGVAAAWAGRLHVGGAGNAHMPLCAVLAMMMPVALHRLAALRDGAPWFRQGLSLTAHGLALFQFSTVCIDPRLAFPSAEDRLASQRVEALLRAVDGDVLVMDDRFYAKLAGKSLPGLDYSVADMMLDARDPRVIGFRHLLVGALRSGRFVGVVDPPDFVRAEVPLGPPVTIQHDLDPGRLGYRARIERYYPVTPPRD